MINKIIIVLAAITAVGFGIFSYQQSSSSNANVHEQLINATYLYDQNTAIADFDLIDHQGNAFTPNNIRNQWTFWFFGFTHCPDICPITLGKLSSVVSRLKTDHNVEDEINIVFVSVDPERDDVDALNTYVSAFSENAIGVTGNDEKLTPFLKNMGIIAVKQDNDGELTDYLVDHSSSIFLIAPNTGISAYFGSPHEVDDIVHDFLTIRKFYQ